MFMCLCIYARLGRLQAESTVASHLSCLYALSHCSCLSAGQQFTGTMQTESMSC